MIMWSLFIYGFRKKVGTDYDQAYPQGNGI